MKRNNITNTTLISLFSCIVVLSIIGISRVEIGSSKSHSDFFFTVTTNYYGINASEIERTITIPMEESFSSVNGISEITSQSKFGESKVFIKVENKKDHSSVYLNIRDKVDIVYQNLPRAVQKPQIYSSSSLSRPSYVIAFNANNIELSALRNHIEQEIKPQFDQLDDTGLIEISGGGQKEIHIQIDPQKAAKWNITINQVASFLQQSHMYQPLGDITIGNIDIPIILNSRFMDIHDIRNLSMNVNGLIMPLKDFASVEHRYRESEAISRVNGEKRVVLYVHSSGDANLITLSNKITKILASLEKKGYSFDLIYNEGESFQKKLKELFIVLAIELVLVLAVLILFGSKKQRILITLSIPFILSITIAIISFLNVTIDQYILSGLAVGIGLMADTGIILTSFFERNSGGSFKATIIALIGSTLTTLIVLVPTLFMDTVIPGIREITLSLAILSLVTLVFNILFIPPFYRKGTSLPKTIPIEKYIQKTASFFIKFPRLVFVLHIIILVCTVGLLFIMNKDFSRNLERGTLFLQIEFPSGFSPSAIDNEISLWQERMEKPKSILIWETKANRGNAQSTIRFDASDVTREELIKQLESQKDLLPYGQLHFTRNSEESGFRIQVHISGDDILILQQLCNESIQKFQQYNWVTRGVLHFKENPPAVFYSPENEILSSSRQTPSSLGSILKWYIQGPVAVKIPFGKREMDLRIMAEESAIKNMNDIDNIPIILNKSAVPLQSILSRKITKEPSMIIRRNKQRSHSFSFIANLDDLDEVIEKVKLILADITIPPGYFFEIDRSLINEKENLQKIFIALIFALIFVYVFLCALLESFRIPVIIISILPATMFFPLLILLITHIGLTISVIVGFILLCGISVNNSILLCEGVEQLKYRKDRQKAASIVLASLKDRTPALLTTTLTTVLASLPLSILSYKDASFSNILALVVFLGIISSFFASIILIPAILAKYYR